MKRLVTLVIPLCVLGLGVVLKTASPPFLQAMQLKVFDSYQAYAPRAYEAVPVSIVDIDEESLQKIGQWPWPRNIVAVLTGRLREEGAAAVAFDIVFAEADRTSPKEILPLWCDGGASFPLRERSSGLEPVERPTPNPAFPLKGGRGGEPSDIPHSVPALCKDFRALLESTDMPGMTDIGDHDAQLGRAIAGANAATGFVLTESGSAAPEVKAGMAIQGDHPAGSMPEFGGAVNTLAVIAKDAAGNGALNSLPDMDGIIRRMPILFNAAGALAPGLTAEALRIAQGAPPLMVKTAEGAIESIRIGEFVIPTDKAGAFWLHYSPSVKERYVPAWQVIEKKLPEGRLNGHIVFIGTSAAGLKDIRSTPLNPVMNGVEVHAQALEQTLLGHFLTRPDWADGAEALALIVAGLGMILLLQFVSPAYGALLAALTVFGAGYGSWYAFTDLRLLFDPVIPSIVLVATYLVETLRQFMLAEREKKQVRDAFSRYMSPALVEKLAANPKALKLGGEMREMTILFSDIRGFTTLSEKYTAEELTRLINRFLTPMTDTILQLRGTIDKYMGDAIMAFWNAPLDNGAHVKDACLAALAMQERLKEVNAAMMQEAAEAGKEYSALAVGIGINTGTCCVGNMGSEQRFDYSVLGDNVNLASRLEGQSKTYGVTVILGENTAKMLSDLAVFEIDRIKVKGKTEAVRIFTLLGDEKMAAGEGFAALKRDFLAMLAAYRGQQFDTARALLAACRTHAAEAGLGIGGLFDLYQERMEEYTANPPPAAWDGVYVALSK